MMAEMGIYETMRTLRAVRRLKPDPIPDDVLRRVLEAATWAPTGANRQPWRIVVDKDPERKRRLGELYAERWNFASKMYRATLTDLPPEGRQSQVRMLAAADHWGAHLGESPMFAIFCFNPHELAL